MIAKARPDDSESRARMYAAKFEGLLPKIQQMAEWAFRRCPCEQREEAVAEVVAHAWIAFRGLLDRGLEDRIFATPLGRYANVSSSRRRPLRWIPSGVVAFIAGAFALPSPLGAQLHQRSTQPEFRIRNGRDKKMG